MRIPDYQDPYLLFGLLFMSNNRLQALGDAFYEEITTKQWFVLAMLDVFGQQAPTIGQLAEQMGSSHQNVKQLVDKLVRKGYLTLQRDIADRRKMRVYPTPSYFALCRKYQHKQEVFMQSLFAGIDPQALHSAVQVLLQLQENMTQLGAAPTAD